MSYILTIPSTAFEAIIFGDFGKYRKRLTSPYCGIHFTTVKFGSNGPSPMQGRGIF